MEKIIAALTDPTVWAGVIIAYALQFFGKKFPSIFRGIIRKSVLRRLRKIRAIRLNQDAVTYESIKAHSYFLFFAGSCAFFFVLVFVGPLAPLLKLPKWIFFSSFSPVLILEIMWLTQDSFARDLVRHRGKAYVKRGGYQRQYL